MMLLIPAERSEKKEVKDYLRGLPNASTIGINVAAVTIVDTINARSRLCIRLGTASVGRKLGQAVMRPTQSGPWIKEAVSARCSE
jgi:hypothetical protein